MKLNNLGVISLLWVFVSADSVVAQECANNLARYYTPASDFVDNGDGTVTHTKTGLMWRRCRVGSEWSASGGCDTGNEYPTWSSALVAANKLEYAGHDDWRLPNVTEMSSIVEWRCSDPALNIDVFPHNEGSFEAFWTATTLLSSPDRARLISLITGESVDELKSESFQFFAVRDVEVDSQ